MQFQGDISAIYGVQTSNNERYIVNGPQRQVMATAIRCEDEDCGAEMPWVPVGGWRAVGTDKSKITGCHRNVLRSRHHPYNLSNTSQPDYHPQSLRTQDHAAPIHRLCSYLNLRRHPHHPLASLARIFPTTMPKQRLKLQNVDHIAVLLAPILNSTAKIPRPMPNCQPALNSYQYTFIHVSQTSQPNLRCSRL